MRTNGIYCLLFGTPNWWSGVCLVKFEIIKVESVTFSACWEENKLKYVCIYICHTYSTRWPLCLHVLVVMMRDAIAYSMKSCVQWLWQDCNTYYIHIYHDVCVCVCGCAMHNVYTLTHAHQMFLLFIIMYRMFLTTSINGYGRSRIAAFVQHNIGCNWNSDSRTNIHENDESIALSA